MNRDRKETSRPGRMEDDMRKIITGAAILVIATVTMAWAVSNSAGTVKVPGGGMVPVHKPLLW
jgi:hypothetical protein